MLRWDVEQATHVYREMIRPTVALSYRLDTLLHAVRFGPLKDPGKPPEVPSLLEDR